MDKNAKYDIFAREFCAGSSIQTAVKAAGYSGTTASLSSTGSRLLKHPAVIALIDQLKAPAFARGQVMAEQWLDRCSEVLNTTNNAFAKLKALELLGRYHALFLDKHELKVLTPGIKIESNDGKKLFSLTVKESTPTNNNNTTAQVSGTSNPEPQEGD